MILKKQFNMADPRDEAMASMGLKRVDANAPAPVAKPATPVQAHAPDPVTPVATAPATPVADPDNPAPVEPKIEVQTPEAKPLEFDESKYLSGKLGGKFTKFEELEASYKELETKANTDPFHSPVVKGLNDYVKGGGDPELYLKLQKLQPDKMSEKEALTLEYMFKKNMTREDAEELVTLKYRLDQPDTDEDGATIREVREARLLSKDAAHDAKAYLKEFIADNSVPPHDKHLASLNKAWEAAAPELSKELATLKVTTPTGALDFPVSEESRKEAQEAVRDMINSGMLDDVESPEGRKLIKEIMASNIKAQEFDRMAAMVQDMTKTAIVAEKHNTRTAVPTATPPSEPKSRDQQIAGFLHQTYYGTGG